MSFDGVDDWVEIPNATFLKGTGSHTISTWIKFSSNPSASEEIFRKDNDGGTGGWGMRIGLSVDGSVTAAAVRTNPSLFQISVSSENPLSTNTWHNAVAVWNSGVDLKIYVDGILSATTTDTGTVMRTSNQSSTIGKILNFSTYHFNGLIDEVKIYNYALTAEQVKMEYSGGAVRFEL